jgi:hypothetical protein
MTIEESNKLIAEFMGVLQHNSLIVIDGIPIHVSNGKYHTSWNWLMPVVRRIVDICIEDDDHFLSDEYTSVLETVSLAVIEDSYKVVIEFIQYYNKQEE